MGPRDGSGKRGAQIMGRMSAASERARGLLMSTRLYAAVGGVVSRLIAALTGKATMWSLVVNCISTEYVCRVGG